MDTHHKLYHYHRLWPWYCADITCGTPVPRCIQEIRSGVRISIPYLPVGDFLYWPSGVCGLSFCKEEDNTLDKLVYFMDRPFFADRIDVQRRCDRGHNAHFGYSIYGIIGDFISIFTTVARKRWSCRNRSLTLLALSYEISFNRRLCFIFYPDLWAESCSINTSTRKDFH